MARGSLVVVGSGIQATGQMTEEARRCIESADRVLHAVSDSLATEWIHRLNPAAEDLLRFYCQGEDRWGAYRAMVQCIHQRVTEGARVCAVFYGHPGVFVFPAHESIRRLREEGYAAEMQPGISAEDCLWADLELDPLQCGCQAFEATDFLVRRRDPDPGSCLVLWQVDAVGDNSYQRGGGDGRHVPLLLEHLYQRYRPDHEAILYDAPVFPLCPPLILRFPLRELPDRVRRARGVATLCIPPAEEASADDALEARLGLLTAPQTGAAGWRLRCR